MDHNIVKIANNMELHHNVTIRVIDANTRQVVASHEGHNAATNSMLLGIAHYLQGDGVLNQGISMLNRYIPKYISLGTMGLNSQVREFAATPPFAIRFDYPIHTLAPDLDPNKTEGSMDGNRVKGNVVKTQLKDERYNEFVRTLEYHLAHGEEVNQAQLARELEVAESTIRNYLKRANDPVQVYRVVKGRNGRIVRLDAPELNPQ